MTPDEIETLEELKRHYALRMGSGRRYYDALRAALRDAAALSRPAPPDDLDEAKLDAALNDALYKYTEIGHMLPWREVERLCGALRRCLMPIAAPAPVVAPSVAQARDEMVEGLEAAGFFRAPVAAPAGPPAGFECCDPRGGAEGCCKRYVPVAAPAPVGESPLAHAAVEATARAHGWDAESDTLAGDTLAGWLHARLLVAAPAPETVIHSRSRNASSVRSIDQAQGRSGVRPQDAEDDPPSPGSPRQSVSPAPAPENPAPDAMPEKRGHQIVARDRDGMPWCETCRKWGVREDGPCDRTYPGSTGRRQEAQP